MNVLTDERTAPRTDAHAMVVTRRSWKTTAWLAVVAVGLVLLTTVGRREGPTTFSWASSTDAFRLPAWVVSADGVTATTSALLWALVLAAATLTWRRRRVPRVLVAAAALLGLLGFLAWAGAGATLPVPGLLIGTIALSAPLIFGALGGVLSERVGVINIAIEGQLMAGAFASAVVATLTGSPLAGLVGAMVAGMLVSFVLAAFSIRYLVDQVIVGVVLIVLVTGLTTFLYRQLLTPYRDTLNSPPRLQPINIPVLSEIPVLGPALFRQTLVVYLMYVAVVVVWLAMYRTRWGLRLRSVGEHPEAADSVGIQVNATRFRVVLLAGAVAGMGGAYFTLGSVGPFIQEMTAGMGFIALAAVIFGRWHPLRATLAALLFGFATNLQSVLGIVGSPLPSEVMLMLPYVVTIVAVAGFVGAVRGPAAEGKPYVRG